MPRKRRPHKRASISPLAQHYRYQPGTRASKLAPRSRSLLTTNQSTKLDARSARTRRLPTANAIIAAEDVRQNRLPELLAAAPSFSSAKGAEGRGQRRLRLRRCVPKNGNANHDCCHVPSNQIATMSACRSRPRRAPATTINQPRKPQLPGLFRAQARYASDRRRLVSRWNWDRTGG